jgi:hypothetical protein
MLIGRFLVFTPVIMAVHYASFLSNLNMRCRLTLFGLLRIISTKISSNKE